MAVVCSSCGAPGTEGALYCSQCGSTLDGAVPLIELAPDAPSARVQSVEVVSEPGVRARWVVLALVAGAVLGLAGWSLLSNDGDEPAAAPVPVTTAVDRAVSTTARPATTERTPTTTRTTTTTTTVPRGPVLGEEVGAVLVSVGTNGRLQALDLDTGEVTLSDVEGRNGVVVFEGQLVVADQCRAWSVLDPLTLDSIRPLTECGFDTWTHPVTAFVDYSSGVSPYGFGRMLVGDGSGGVIEVQMPEIESAYPTHFSSGMVLWDVAGAGMVRQDATTGELTSYADGRLIMAVADTILWQTCVVDLTCTTWLGTPSEPQARNVTTALPQGYRVSSLAPDGTKAILSEVNTGRTEIVDLNTGAIIELPVWLEGYDASWTPDGHWIVAQNYSGSAAGVRAISTLDGSVRDLPGVAVGRGPLAIVEKP